MTGKRGADWQSYQPDWAAYCSQLLARTRDSDPSVLDAVPRSEAEQWIATIPPGIEPREAGKLVAGFLAGYARENRNPRSTLTQGYRVDRDARLGAVLEAARCDGALDLVRDTSYWGMTGDRHVERLVARGVPLDRAYEVMRVYQLWWMDTLPARFHPQVRLSSFEDLAREHQQRPSPPTGELSRSDTSERYSDWQSYEPDWTGYCSQLLAGLTGGVFSQPSRVPDAEAKRFVARLPQNTDPATAWQAIASVLLPYYPHNDQFTDYEVLEEARDIDTRSRLGAVLALAGRDDAAHLINVIEYMGHNGDDYVRMLVRRGVSLETPYEVARLRQLQWMDMFPVDEVGEQVGLRSLDELRREHERQHVVVAWLSRYPHRVREDWQFWLRRIGTRRKS